MHLRTISRHATLSIVLVSTAIVVVACKHLGEKREDAGISALAVDLSRTPPGIVDATIQALPNETARGNAVLEVEFEKDTRIGNSVTIFPEGKAVVLRDDGRDGDQKAGDGIFSGVVNFDFNEIAKTASQAAKAIQFIRPRAIFDGRQIIGVEDADTIRQRIDRAVALRDIKSLVRDRAKINIIDLLPIWEYFFIDPPRSLMVTDPSVVQDPTRTIDPCTNIGNPNGVWTFKHLVTEMVAGTGVDPADFVEQWLRLWDSNQMVSSGFIAAPRPSMLPAIISPWPRTAAGKLDLDQSPFRLSAIVNRIDLAKNSIYGASSGAEGRFVFGVRDRSKPGCQFLQFSVILEYGIPRNSCASMKDWALQWVALSSKPLGSDDYKNALQAITEQFAKAHAAAGKPNGSALNQIRTNEKALDPAAGLWELREFKLTNASPMLTEVTTAQTVDVTINRTTNLASYINANSTAIQSDNYNVPDRFPAATPFKAATSHAEAANQLATHFEAPNVTIPNARFHFSLNNCASCHIRETSTNGTPPGNNLFLHVDPTFMPARLSHFLTGKTPDITDGPDEFIVADPVSPLPPSPDDKHPFNDLDHRREILANIATSPCLARIFVPARQLLERVPKIGPDGQLPVIRDPRLAGLVNDPVRSVH